MDVYVDIDENYDEWYHSNHFNTVRDKILNKMAGVDGAWVRPSSSNHVHVRVKMAYDQSFLKQMCIRAFLGDDPQRLACDLERFYRDKDQENCGRCFDEKYTRGRVKKAGEWIRIV